MPDATCSIDGCRARVIARGWCDKHYARWRVYGDPRYESIRDDIALKFWRNVDKRGPDECWPWLGSVHHSGYGVIQVGGVQRQAHRIAYELTFGAIPDGLTIDHVRSRGCVRRDCMNPSHLEPVTGRVNSQRRSEAITHCPQGHPYDVKNTRIYHGRRYCRACSRERNRRRRTREAP